MYSIGWFSTAKGQGSRNLLAAVQESILCRDIKATIECIFLSREPGESSETDKFIELASTYGIPVVSYSYQRYRKERGYLDSGSNVLPDWRLGYDREVMRRLECFTQPDLCVLAGYMLIVGPEMCSHFTMINLHPAAPDGPTGTWQEVIWKLIDTKAKSSGVMTHLVTPELDKGPVASFCVFPIHGKTFDALWKEGDGLDSNAVNISEGEQNRLFQEIRRHGAARELPLIVSTVKAFVDGNIKVSKGLIIDRNNAAIKGYDLSVAIDSLVKTKLDAQP
ncbi:MAG: phosphoglycerate transporter [Dehalococcoidia bacterium]|nr:MAG: phosphoglycerate transporter [Dehalococcoidia bacterium]